MRASKFIMTQAVHRCEGSRVVDCLPTNALEHIQAVLDERDELGDCSVWNNK